MPRTRTAIIAVASLLLTASVDTGQLVPFAVALPDGTRLQVETVVDGLDTVWDMNWAPDGAMWITERGGRVSRVDVRTGTVTPVGTVPGVNERGEGGLMGFDFHPEFPRQPWVYFAHTHSGGSGGGGTGNRLMRMRYENGRLGGAETLIDGIRGAGNHNGARIAFGPDGHLYMTMGEAGNRPLSQDTSSLNGKVLRVTVDGRPAPGNPFGNEVWSWGHRNPQGLDFQPGTGVPYVAEHGAGREDEIDRIERGGNYGWPMVEGMCDEADEREYCTARYIEPVEVFRPTVGIAGMAFYDGDAIAGWKGNILAVALRGESLYRIVLTPDGRRSANTERLFQGEFGRLRDVLPGPDGVVYLATSNADGRGRPARADRILRIRP